MRGIPRDYHRQIGLALLTTVGIYLCDRWRSTAHRERVRQRSRLYARLYSYRSATGCGIGIDGAQFARHGARYIGVDLSEASAGMARERFRAFARDRLSNS